ncbi:hypothetical protein BTO04_08070 [Polaribacter sp. SA4-10]|uniref:hypothetical protein n=1 Tax=Polaribacter sp. SA4-10 TaxID=754397 RepID=UPI000B3C6139|nr:hypothetical protein [Polaribacter sp. SA4-10]ARV06654.1 hypothetical protein BTO04_08070 [Polaribacter sp. SA4-10]
MSEKEIMSKEMIDFINKKQNEIRIERNSEFFSFIKQILVLSTTLLGLTIAFNKFFENKGHYLLLISSIFLFGLNILLSLIVWYEKIKNLDNGILALEKRRKLIEDGNNDNAKDIFVPFGKFFEKTTKTLYVSFFLSVVSLCLFGALSITEKENKELQKENSIKPIKLKQVDSLSNKFFKHK